MSWLIATGAASKGVGKGGPEVTKATQLQAKTFGWLALCISCGVHCISCHLTANVFYWIFLLEKTTSSIVALRGLLMYCTILYFSWVSCDAVKIYSNVQDGLWVLPLHSMISVNEQRLVFKRPPSRARKVWQNDSFSSLLFNFSRIFVGRTARWSSLRTSPKHPSPLTMWNMILS